MRFREYTAADLDAMHHLDAVCFTEAFRFDRLTMQQFAEEPGAIVVLVEEGKPATLVAFVIVHMEAEGNGTRGYIVTIDVSPEHRRRGLGAAMLDRAEVAARAAGASKIHLHVSADNPAAISFYERQKYQRAGVARGFYREAEQDAIVFFKTL